MRKRLCCLAMSMLLAVTGVAVPFSAFAAKKDADNGELNSETQKVIDAYNGGENDSYYDYYLHYENAPLHYGYVSVKGTDFSKAEKSKTGTYDKVKAVVLDDDNGWVEYKVNIPEDGKYGITLDYYQLPHKEKDIEITVSVDGKIPYSEARQISVPRIWEDEINAENVPDGAYFECSDKDGNADDVRPTQIEKKIWTSRELINVQGLYDEPYQFYLKKGVHTIRLTLEKEAVAISKVNIGNEMPAVSYDEYIAQFSDSDYVKNNGVAFGEDGDLSAKVQAEQTFSKNNVVIYPTYDKSGASTQPNDPAYTKLNTIGTTNWATNGDEIVWEVNVKKAGLYKLAMRSRQNYNAGMFAYRTLRVNGEIPFAEATGIKFKYQQSWYMLTLGEEGKDYYIYLNEGTNKLSLSCTTGEMSEVLRNVQQAVLDMNALYRQIIAVTSTSPDSYRDYSLEAQIPTLLGDMKELATFLDDTGKLVKEITGTDGSQASSINYAAQVVTDLSEDAYQIPERLSKFKSCIETLASLVGTLSNLALELDYLVVLPVDTAAPSVSDGFFNSVAFSWNQFISSFIVDYNSTSATEETGDDVDQVKVWVSTGRDQANIINRLISDNRDQLVTADGKQISVQLSMVDTGATLIRATLAGKGPDCALMIGEDTPMNLAARGALVPLTSYKKNLESQFKKCAWTPFYYNGEYYALPETQQFDVMFYRSDILEELGISVPKTWDDFYKAMEVIQNANLVIGIPEVNSANAGVSSGIATFDKFLLQNGGTYYTDNLDKTRFTDEVAYSAFESWTELYSKYALDRSFDFYSRFRSGEMPISLQLYSAYNQVKSAAPELNGLWSFAPIPGTVQDDGTVNISENSAVTGCIMLKSAQTKGIEDAASTFLSWWVSADTQAEYARELEATLGVAARYTPANIKAFDALGWTDGEAAIIKEQWDSVTVMNEVPGNYLLKRSLTSAFRSVMSGKNAARRALTIYNKDINDEIARKRKEFGLE